MKVGQNGNLNRGTDAASTTATGIADLGQSSKAGKKAKMGLGGVERPIDSASVAMSDQARSFKRAKELASADPGVDEAKIARLQKLIDEGKYKVDAAAVADRLVDEHLKTEI